MDHYRDIQLTPERIAEIDKDLRAALGTKRAEAETIERGLDLRIARLTDERQKLLQLYYAEAVPADLFKQDQERITRGLKQAREQLASVSLEFDAIEQNLHRALKLAKDCHAAYEDADNNIRRLFNQAFFDKIKVHEDGEITHELAEPFKILLDPKLRNQIEAAPRKEELNQPDSSENGYLWPRNENDLEENEAVVSNVDTLVPEARLELARAMCPTDFKSAASTIPPLRHAQPSIRRATVGRELPSVGTAVTQELRPVGTAD